MLNIGVINKYTVNYGIGSGEYSVLANYQSFLSNLFLLAPPLIIFLYKLYTK